MRLEQIDFAQLIKLYGNAGQTKEDQRRYSPAECTGTEKRRITGNPNIKGSFYKLCRAPKFNHAYAYAPIHPPDQCI